jgi:hypothetical protein
MGAIATGCQINAVGLKMSKILWEKGGEGSVSGRGKGEMGDIIWSLLAS